MAHLPPVRRHHVGRSPEPGGAPELGHDLAAGISRLGAARVLGAPTRDFVTELRRTLERQRSMLDAQNLDWFTAADQLLHRQMFEFADVGELWRLVRSRSGDIDRLRRLHLPASGKAASILDDHRKIVDAIEAGDPHSAEAAMREHLSGTLSELELICERYPDYVKVHD